MATGALGLRFIRGQQQTFKFAAAMLAAVLIQRHAVFLLIHQVSMDYYYGVNLGLTTGIQDFLGLVDRYPSEYHPPPFNSKVQRDMIFWAR